MYRYLMDHENRILYYIRSGNVQDWNIFRDYYKTQIGFIQHERLIHLIVTITFTFLMLVAYGITVFYAFWMVILLDIALTALVVLYIFHYYRLENGVQRWYGLYDQICKKSGGISTGQPESQPVRHIEMQPANMPGIIKEKLKKTAPEQAPEQAPKMVPEAAPETAPEPVPDRTRETVPETTPDRIQESQSEILTENQTETDLRLENLQCPAVHA
ncbi:MAG TPA: hypothetical protein VHT96_13545 [Clostridia bacterium]|nr:hypothetical protein [Clostridia bacterium]